jgi:tetratricopeptide (TPR) repeat protein
VKSRLLIRLEADLQNNANSLAVDCLRCELAAYFARLGDVDKARFEFREVHKRYAVRPHAAVSAWLNLADALIGYHSNPEPLASEIACDKMKRAHAISAAVGMQPLQSLSAGWLAYLAQQRGDAAPTVRYAAEALRLARAEHHASRARASLVVARAYHANGHFDLARGWYDRARRHSIAEGDDAMLSALLWTTATQRVANVRQTLALNPSGTGISSIQKSAVHNSIDDKTCPEKSMRDHAWLSCESSVSFDKLRGVRGRQTLQPILQAQLLTLLGQTAEALPLFDLHLEASLNEGMRSSEATLLADRAWCRVRAHRLQGARDDARTAQMCLQTTMAWGNRAPGHSRLTQVFHALGEPESARHHERQAADAWKCNARDQAEMTDTLNREFAGWCTD